MQQKAIRRAIKRIIPRSAITAVRSMIYYGNEHVCPVCGSSLRMLQDAGYGYPVLEELRVVGGMRKKSDICPVCHSADRTRLVYLYVSHHSDLLNAPVSLLHFAPEDGLLKHFLACRNLDYVPSDINAERYRHVPGLRSFDLQNIGEPDGRFDWIICNHVIEHVPDDRRAMAELFRVLKSGGRAILQVPISLVLSKTREDPTAATDEDRIRLFGQFDHLRLYAADYYDRLRDAGFRIELWDAFASDPERAAQWNLNPLEKLCVARKP